MLEYRLLSRLCYLSLNPFNKVLATHARRECLVLSLMLMDNWGDGHVGAESIGGTGQRLSLAIPTLHHL